MPRVQWGNGCRLPSIRLANQYAATAAKAVEHDQPCCFVMISHAVVIAAIRIETAPQTGPNTGAKKPSIAKLPLAVVIFRAPVKDTAAENRIVRKRRIAPGFRTWPRDVVPSVSVKQPGVA